MTLPADRAVDHARRQRGPPGRRVPPRPAQEPIRHVVHGDGRLLQVQKTGWGKSFVYFIAAKLLRKADRRPTLFISPPARSSWCNQIAARMGSPSIPTAPTKSSAGRDLEEQVRVDLPLIDRALSHGVLATTAIDRVHDDLSPLRASTCRSPRRPGQPLVGPTESPFRSGRPGRGIVNLNVRDADHVAGALTPATSPSTLHQRERPHRAKLHQAFSTTPSSR